jgi:serine/threonine-protein kinase
MQAGSHIGSYEILSPIGEGGMGVVYKARDTKLGRSVAVKVLPDVFANDAERIGRLQREAHILASLNHPNIAAIYGMEDRAIIMELVDGRTLQGPLPLDQAIPVAKQIAEGLEAAHEKTIIHRDLKPANIKITSEGKVKILDFGLARALAGDPATGNPATSPTLTIAATTMGVILGTAAYMSPEQARGRPADKRSDIWSFGVVLYEILTGKQLFEGESISDTLAEVLKKEIDFSLVPAPLRKLLQRCLTRDRRQRLQDIGEARIMLEQPEEQPPSPAAPKKIWLPWALAAAGCTMAVVLAALHLSGPSLQPRPVRRFSITPEQFRRTAVISPNGKHIVFEGEGKLWIRDLDREGVRALEGTEDGDYPFWSPDSETIGYRNGLVFRYVRAQGGGGGLICPRASRSIGTWSADGKSIFLSSGLRAGLTPEIHEVPAMGGNPKLVFRASAPFNYLMVEQDLTAVSGKRVLLTTAFQQDKSVVALADLASGRLTEIAAGRRPAYSSTGHILFRNDFGIHALPYSARTLAAAGAPFQVSENKSPTGLSVSLDGTLVFGAGGGDQLEQLVWKDRAGNSRGVAGEPQHGIIYPSISPDGTRVAFSATDKENQDIWVYDLKRSLRTRLTFDPASDFMPVWSPSGAEIAFSSARKGDFDVFLQAADGSAEARALVASPIGEFSRGWSRTGVLLFNRVESPTGWDLWTITRNLKGGFSDPAAFLKTPATEILGAISADGRLIAYVSDESGRNEVIVKQVPDTGGKWQVSTNGGFWPQWSSDGQELFYTERDTLMAVPVVASGSFSAERPERLFDLPPGGAMNYRRYAPAADGRSFLVVEPVAGAAAQSRRIQVVENWFEEFRAKQEAAK